MEKHSLQDRVNKLSKTLEDTTLRLSTEVDVASEMKSQLAELKLEYIAAGDKLEAEQSVIRELQVCVFCFNISNLFWLFFKYFASIST